MCEVYVPWNTINCVFIQEQEWNSMYKGRLGKSDDMWTLIWKSFHCEFSYVLSTFLRLLLENTTNDIPIAVKNKN